MPIGSKQFVRIWEEQPPDTSAGSTVGPKADGCLQVLTGTVRPHVHYANIPVFPHPDQQFLLICFAPQFVDSSHLVNKKQVTHTVAVGISPMICDAQTYITCLFPYRLWRGMGINPFPISVVLIFFVVLRIKPWAVHIRGKHWTVRHQATSPGELAWF